MKQETYDIIWDRLIIPTFNDYNFKTGGIICPLAGYHEIYTYYNELVTFAKAHYMAKNTSLLNRHKVAAAIMIAILKAKPIKKIDPIFYEPDKDGNITVWPLNESLAITVALSILRAFIMERVDKAFKDEPVSKSVFEDVCKEDSIIFKKGIPITKKEREEWEWELYQIRQDGAYNLLIMAHVLNYLEKNARLQFFVNHKDIVPTHPIFSDDGKTSPFEHDEPVGVDDAVQKNLK